MRRKGLILLFVALLMAATALQAQETRGQVLGRVTDPTGAVVVGVAVTGTNTATNVRTVATTNHSGDYMLPFLIPGTYTVVVEMRGFKKFVQDGIGVQVNDRATLNVSLEIRQASETV